MPEAGLGNAQALRISAAGTARRQAHRVGARSGVNGGVSEIADDGGECRAAGEIRSGARLGVQGSDGSRGRCIRGAGTRTASGGTEWQVIPERWD